MDLKAKKTPFLILGLTSIACSSGMFFLFHDPEGPNLVVVTGMALILFALSLGVYFLNPFKVFNPSRTPDDKHSSMGLKRLWMVIVTQLVIAAGFYVCLK